MLNQILIHVFLHILQQEDQLRLQPVAIKVAAIPITLAALEALFIVSKTQAGIHGHSAARRNNEAPVESTKTLATN